MGTADTPAAPISGLILPPLSLHINFPRSTPPAVPAENATKPIATIPKVCKVKKRSAEAVAPTVVPNKIVTVYSRAFLAVSTKCGTTPLSFNKFPSISIPIKGAADGTSKVTIIVTAIGKIIFSFLLT